MSKIDHETVSPVSANDDSRATARSPVLRSSAPRGCWWERLSSGAIGCSVSHRRRRHGLGNLPPRATKSDAFDAFTLADSVRHEHRQWRSLAVPSMLLAEFRALTRDQDRLIWEQRDVESKLRGIVQNYYPAVLPLFSSLDRDISLAFLRATPPHSGRTGRGGRMAAFCGSPRIIRSYQGECWSGVADEPALGLGRTSAGNAFSAMLFVDHLELRPRAAAVGAGWPRPGLVTRRGGRA